MIFLFPTTKPPSLSLTIQHGRTELNFHLDPWQTKQRERRGREGGGASTARKKRGEDRERRQQRLFLQRLRPQNTKTHTPFFSRNLFILFSSTTLPLTANRKFFFGREGLGRTDCAAFRPVIPKTSFLFFSSFLVLFFCCFDYSPKVVAVARLSCRCPSLQSSPCFLFFSSPSLSLSSPTTQHPLIISYYYIWSVFFLSGSLYIKYAMVIVFFFKPMV